MDRQVIGILKPTLQAEIGWNEIDYGNIVFAFQLAYAIGLLVVGRLMDRMGTRRGFSFAIVVWSIAAMAHAWARSVTGFMIARFALGLGEAGNFPASIKTVAEWFPRKERALATGIFNAGTNVGAVVAPLVVPFLTLLRLAVGVHRHRRPRPRGWPSGWYLPPPGGPPLPRRAGHIRKATSEAGRRRLGTRCCATGSCGRSPAVRTDPICE